MTLREAYNTIAATPTNLAFLNNMEHLLARLHLSSGSKLNYVNGNITVHDASTIQIQIYKPLSTHFFTLKDIEEEKFLIGMGKL